MSGFGPKEIREASIERPKCSAPNVKRTHKRCGCVSVAVCTTCGREDRFAEDYHRDTCPQAYATQRVAGP